LISLGFVYVDVCVCVCEKERERDKVWLFSPANLELMILLPQPPGADITDMYHHAWANDFFTFP
jgi:hypothetical protein